MEIFCYRLGDGSAPLVPIARDHCDEVTPDERAPFRFVVVSFSSPRKKQNGAPRGGSD